MLNMKDMYSNTVVGHKRSRIDERSSMLWRRRLGHILRPRIERLLKTPFFMTKTSLILILVLIASMENSLLKLETKLQTGLMMYYN